jgi:hypothetical protein
MWRRKILLEARKLLDRASLHIDLPGMILERLTVQPFTYLSSKRSSSMLGLRPFLFLAYPPRTALWTSAIEKLPVFVFLEVVKL